MWRRRGGHITPPAILAGQSSVNVEVGEEGRRGCKFSLSQGKAD